MNEIVYMKKESWKNLLGKIREKNPSAGDMTVVGATEAIGNIEAGDGGSSDTYDSLDPLKVYEKTRPNDWLKMPTPETDEIYMLVLLSNNDEISEGVDNTVSFTIKATGNITCDVGAIVGGEFVSQYTDERQSPATFTLTMNSNDYGNETTDGYKQALIRVRGTDITSFKKTILFFVHEISANIPKCNAFTITDVSNLKYVSLPHNSITNMGRLFSNCQALTAVLALDTSHATSMYEMFFQCYSLQAIPQMDTRNVTNMSRMFYFCSALTAIQQMDTGNVTDMSHMFYNCYSLKKIPQMDTGNVATMSNMFYGCCTLKEIPLLDTKNVTTMNSMFASCRSLLSIPLLDTKNVTDMSSMFSYCTSLLDVPMLDTQSVENFSNMFSNCHSLKSVNLYRTDKATKMDSMFYLSSSLQFLKLGADGDKEVQPLLSDVLSQFTLLKIYVYGYLLDAYKKSTNWSKYADRIFSYGERVDLASIAIVGADKINTYVTHEIQLKVDYGYVKEEQLGVAWAVSGPATITKDGVLTLTDDAGAGDVVTVTATSTYDSSISATHAIDITYMVPSYSVDLGDGQWIDSGSTVDGATVYKSDAGSYNVSNGKSIATITVNGYERFVFYIRSYAENTYDYAEAFTIDTDAVRGNGVYTTKGKQSHTTYIECAYDLDGGEHTIQIMYSKDGSGNNNDDRGYFYIPEQEV